MIGGRPAGPTSTMLHALTIDPRRPLADPQGHPFVPSDGRPIPGLLS